MKRFVYFTLGFVCAALAVVLAMSVPITAAQEPSTLLNGLVSYWKMDEHSGTRADAHGSNDLSVSGSPAWHVGKLGDAALFANDGYLYHASNADLQTGNISFTLATWVYLNPDYTSETYGIVYKGEGDFIEYALAVDSGGFHFVVGNDGSENSGADSNVSAVANQWYYIVAWVDGDTVNMQVNNAEPTMSGVISPLSAGNANLKIGSAFAGYATFAGRIDSVALWKRALTLEERSLLWYGGAGSDYPFRCWLEPAACVCGRSGRT